MGFHRFLWHRLDLSFYLTEVVIDDDETILFVVHAHRYEFFLAIVVV